uniref:Putative secreted protein n=1 Tax=Anopheles darlingi TaxID=43151 RepID=A0A2M4DCI6_ANODA
MMLLLLLLLVLVMLLIVRREVWMVAAERTVSQVTFHRRSYDDATRLRPGRRRSGGLRGRRLGWCPLIEATAEHEPVHLPIEGTP